MLLFEFFRFSEISKTRHLPVHAVQWHKEQ